MKESSRSLWVKLEAEVRRSFASPRVKGRRNHDPKALGEETIERIRIRESLM